MSNYCSKGHWENSMQFPCKQCEIESLREQVEKLTEESVVLRASSRSKLETTSSLELQVEKLESLVVMRCDLDVPPQFSQGLQSHEVLEPVTAEHCQWFVAEIEKLRKERETHLYLAEQNKQLKAELKSIDGALNDPRANLTLTTSEIIWELKDKLEKLTKERDGLRSRRCEVCGYLEHEREHTGCLREQLLALAEQNTKMRKALTKWRYLDSSYNWRCGHCGNEEGDEHKEGCALSLPDLATSILNKEGEIK